MEPMKNDIEIPDPLPLRNIDVPREVSQVEGCDCGGVEWHRASSWSDPQACSIWSLPPEQARANIDAAHERERAFTAALNAKLRAALGPVADTRPSNPAARSDDGWPIDRTAT